MHDWVRRQLDAPIIGRYRHYSAAQAAATYLVEQGIPAKQMAVMAEDIRAVEAPPGNVTVRESALHGAVAGVASAVLLVLGSHLQVIEPAVGFGAFVYAVAFGAIAGVLGGLSLSVLRRGFPRGPGDWNLHALRYRLLADPEIAPRAELILERRDLAAGGVAAASVGPGQRRASADSSRWRKPATARDEAAREDAVFGRTPLG